MADVHPGSPSLVVMSNDAWKLLKAPRKRQNARPGRFSSGSDCCVTSKILQIAAVSKKWHALNAAVALVMFWVCMAPGCAEVTLIPRNDPRVFRDALALRTSFLDCLLAPGSPKLHLACLLGNRVCLLAPCYNGSLSVWGSRNAC